MDLPQSIDSLKEEIATLNERQDNALELAAFVGMSPLETLEFDKRRAKIHELKKQLEELKELDR